MNIEMMIRRRLKNVALAILVCFCAGVADAGVSLPPVFGNTMVLQRAVDVPVWGEAPPGDTVVVEFADQKMAAKTEADGTWMIRLKPMPACSVGKTLTVTCRKERIEVTDVLVGDVWFCAGQSNMEMPVYLTDNAEQEMAAADVPQIRYFKLPNRVSGTPQKSVEGQWVACSPKTVAGFSAVGYYFARYLNKKLNVPIGLINGSWGGTHIHGFIPIEGFETEPALSGELDWYQRVVADYVKLRDNYVKAYGDWLPQAQEALKNKLTPPDPPQVAWPAHPMSDNRHSMTALYNTMIHPLLRIPIRGVIWYQGEQNIIDGLFYYVRMKALIQGWRKVWKRDDLPFYFVQLAPCHYPQPWQLPLIWSAQTHVADTVPYTGMAVINDIGAPDDVHPKNKRDVGKRLALCALAGTYGQKNIVCSGPRYKSMAIEGDRIRVHFTHTAKGLRSRDKKPLTWFTIAGEDGRFVPATAVIDGETVLVHSENVAKPTAVRFAWDGCANPNLVNSEHLPTAAFRSEPVEEKRFYIWRGASCPSLETD